MKDEKQKTPRSGPPTGKIDNEVLSAYYNIIDIENTIHGCRTKSFDGDYDADGNELNDILITDAPRRHGGTLNSDTVGD